MEALTKQENNIAEMVAFGLSEKEISAKLFIAESTVHTHTKNIRKKIDARSAVDVARFYILENPAKFFLATMFLIIQVFMIVSVNDFEMRKPKTARRTVKVRRYEA
jgi:DNA-binding CsgD family transcriptional regulator